MARASATYSPRTLPSGSRVVDVTVLFSGFPLAGATPFNQPHAAIDKNGVRVHDDQPMFNGAVYQLDAERLSVRAGDVIKVSAWWAAAETRDGSEQEEIVVSRYDAW